MSYIESRICELVISNIPSKDNEMLIRIDGFDSLDLYNYNFPNE